LVREVPGFVRNRRRLNEALVRPVLEALLSPGHVVDGIDREIGTWIPFGPISRAIDSARMRRAVLFGAKLAKFALPRSAEVCAPERRYCALRFHLAAAAVVVGDHDVAGQHHFDADGEGRALHGR
jgi:hypothetical protein